MKKELEVKPGKPLKNGKKPVKVLGPIDDLAKYVRPDWWKNLFTSLYLKTDADVVDDEGITAKEVDLFIDMLKLQPDDRILDLCCGHGRHSLELARRGFRNVEGLDRSAYLIQKARNTAKKENLIVKFREGDARKLPYPADTFDAVMILGNSFGYFETVEDDMRILKEVFRVLKPWGKLLIDVADGEYVKKNFQPRSWEWIDKKYYVCRERTLSVDEQRLICREVIAHVNKGVLADQFYAERLYTKESLTKFLTAAGFTDLVFQGEIATDSKRKQDLGMMEQRIVLTAIVKKEWSPIKRKPKVEVKNVVVILGDPTKRDPVKPATVFDDDDIYTIDQMKDALRELKDYNFTYLNDHDTLISDLIKMKEKIDYVFNLCDEGYFNDPRKELHVPALLDVLGIPYTGAGPQCLAICYDKSLVRGVAREMGIPVPDAIFIKPEDKTFEINFDFPVIVKPNFGDSSFGITQKSVAYNREEFILAISEIRDKFGYDKHILVEEFLQGKDLSVGIIGNPPDYTVLPITEEDYSTIPEDLPKICGYEAKWLPDSPYWNIKTIVADLPSETHDLIVEWCVKLFTRLECRDYARFDWRLDENGVPKLLEVNPNPGWCWDGHLAKMAKFAGLSYSNMLGAILEAAEKRLNIHKEER
ncbi:MAG: methyltransferase domain-containing protein [Candidatus Odinarchaeum yellowstonii]|uniref:Methyltransferase domain-containing protein n=1 Tax=Odinarchaeota yellowstonii (strain LCB_4) TaxID=1841599 RepID=A0AAF0D2A5_ODILC|nr:MAG: methyltransferase domain-containing protein [Candidatus Odinarchaeum yellowstonii]